MAESGFIEERQIAIFLSAVNAETFEKLGDESADAEGHIVSGAVLRRKSVDRSYVPVRVRVAHGVASQTAVAMLRKIADLIESEPDFLSADPGTAIRRLPDGTSLRKKLTPKGILDAMDRLDKDDQVRLMAMMDEIKLELTDDSFHDERGEDPE